MIEVRGITATFNRNTAIERRALNGIDFTVPAGQFVTIIGSNGAGKSTLLNVIAGEVKPDAGRILIDGEDVSARAVEARAAGVARVFQDPRTGTCESLSIEENLALAARRGARRGLGLGVTRELRAEFRERLADLDLGLEARLGDPVSLLSGGQRQALSLLMAALRPAKVLLLDEHVSALDPRTASFVLDLTRRIVEKHSLTTLMVTHSMRAALDIGHRTIMLDGGAIVFDVAGEERVGLTVTDLTRMFRKVRGEEIVEDELLLG